MREIVVDTETTGLDPAAGHRIVEVACVELLNHVPTGRHFHSYVDPERDMPEEAYRIHGLSADFLAAHPVFEKIADELVGFLGDATLVIHNAEFDMRFLNAELALVGRPALPIGRAVDTVALARRRFPGAQVNLDALCRRFEIDLSEREQHGALVDAKLLAAVYLELLGGRQPGLELAAETAAPGAAAFVERQARAARAHAPSAAELAAHATLVDALDDPIWRK
ncbi:MAG: DNA polymerase III subunit epsilon [Alphaproteobacteria bacterium]